MHPGSPPSRYRQKEPPASARGVFGWIKGVLEQARQSYSHTPRTMRLVWSASPKGTLLLAVLTLVASGVPLGVAYAGKRIIDQVVLRDRTSAVHWVILELALVAGMALVQRTLALLRSTLGARLSLDVNLMILEKAGTLELSHFEDPEFYDRLTRARREASSRPIAVVTETFQLIQNILTLAGYTTLLLRFSGLAVLGLVLAALPATIAEMRFSSQAFRLRNWRAPEARRLAYLEYVLANEGHVKEVQLFGLGPLFLSRYRELGERMYGEDTKLATKRAGYGFLLSLLATLAYYGCYAFLAMAAALGKLSLGDLTLYVVAFRQGQQAFQSVLSAIGGMYEDNLYMSNLFDYLAIPTGTSLTRADRDAEHEKLPKSAEESIVFDNVGFCYPGREEWALRNVNLTIPRGQSLAIVGQNGSGKTTFIKLLTRLYEPTEGRILLEGKDLRDWDREELRKRIGVIFQDFNKYQLPASENVGVGSVEHLTDETRVERAIDQAGATEMVTALPGGMNAPLGRWFRSEGVELSGGQWQKIAIARAYMREEADILVLDEPTAALDAEAEHAVFQRFRELSRGRTTILVSHRFPTVRSADRIVVLEKGKIVEEGTHASLVQGDGRYARLFKMQAEGYL